MKVIRGMFWGFSTVSIILVLMLMSSIDTWDESNVGSVIIITIFAVVFGVAAFILNNPNKLLKYIIPTIVCISAKVYTIFKVDTRLTVHSYKLYHKYGSYKKLFKVCKDKWNRVAEEELTHMII